MKYTLPSILLTSSIWALTSIFSVPPNVIAFTQIAQSQNNNELFYTYKGQRIPLKQRQDVIAVAFKRVTTRGRGDATPLFLQLQQDLQGGTRSISPQIQVSPLGENYAVVNLPSSVRDTALQQRIQQQPYVQSTLPVLTRNESQEIIALPNEIIITFKSGLSNSEKEAIFKQNNLVVIRRLRFNPNHYLVKSTTASGVSVLNVTNQLNQVKEVTATPNFIETVSDSTKKQDVKLLNQKLNYQQNSIQNFWGQNFLSLQWYLDSVPLKQCLQQQISNFDLLQNCLKTQTAATKSFLPRTDLRVTDAWKHSNGGRGVVVAVIDSLIQWDHPDLAQNVYTVTAADKCPNEFHGWDFSNETNTNSSNPCDIGDADTRANPLELTILKRKFQDTFKLSDAELLQKYFLEGQRIKLKYPRLSPEETAQKVRHFIRSYEVGSEFHGTLVSGVIAAKPNHTQGIMGVAPNAQILPVRVFGLNGSFSPSAYIEAIGYAAARGADIINLSLGATLPTDGEEQAITQVLEAYPKLVIVAASGNEDSNRVTYPAAYPGVLSVGATNLSGDRASYSNYGRGLDVVAPGGDYDSPGLLGGIATTGGTWLEAFWQGIPNPTSRWSEVIDNRGKYWWVQGTSFSSPAVAGVLALMKGEDSNRRRDRKEFIHILESTASYEGLTISEEQAKLYRSQINQDPLPSSITDKQYFFGHGLVNADAAVSAVQK
jgi:serine protease